jgi:hypothetical protein
VDESREASIELPGTVNEKLYDEHFLQMNQQIESLEDKIANVQKSLKSAVASMAKDLADQD